MKRVLISLGLVFCFVVQVVPSATAVTKYDSVLKGFQTYVSTAKSSLSNATQKYNNDVATINAMYASSVQTTKSIFENEIFSAKNLYEPQINNAIQAIQDAQAKLLTVNQVKVVKQGSDRNSWGYLNCSATRPACIYVDKGPLFQIGEVTTLKTFAGNSWEFDYFRGIQQMIDDGLIELLNAGEYQKTVNTIRTKTDDQKTLTLQWEMTNSAAMKKQSTALESARLVAGVPLSELMQNYDSNKLTFGNQISAGNSAIRAAKRASKNSSVFDKAFVAAFKFQYNVKGLDNIANLPFSSLNTLRSVLSQYSIIELADKAAGVDASYSFSGAESINKSVGNVFTSDKEFQIPAKLVASEYKKLTKVSIKF